MRNILLPVLGLIFSFLSVAQDIKNPAVITGELIKVVPSVKSLRHDPNFNPRVTRDLTGLITKKSFKDDATDYGTRAGSDPVLQKKFFSGMQGLMNSPSSQNSGGVIDKNFEGMGFSNVSPADPSMTAGPSHIIQMINGAQGAYFKIWDRNGNMIINQTYLFQLFSSPAYSGAGDPIVLYDQFADRYVMSEFGYSDGITFFLNTLVIAISQTNDPTAGWYIYKFVDNSFHVDYPHYAAWPDALYATTNDFNTAGTAYLGSSVYAFDKQKMITGDPTATMQKFRLNSSQYIKFQSIAPINISGTIPPVFGAPGMFIYFHDDNRTSSTTDVDSVGIITLKADFSNPSNTLLNFTQQLAVAPFKSRVCNGSRNCIPSGGASGYDEIGDRFMNKVYYRNFGTYETIVANHTVDASYPSLPSKAGLRWYEFRRTGAAWSTFQQGTYAPDSDGRWMGAININSKGQIALAFNSSGPGKYASIHFTGRNSTDPPGLMVYDESELQKGDGYGTFSNRWGDYNDLVTDVVNDSLFWYTAMYGSVNWKTKVSSFKLEPHPQVDVRLVNINTPEQGMAQCANGILPNVTIRNAGSDVLTALTINTQIDNGPVVATSWTGSLNITQSADVSLQPLTATPGTHILKVYTTNPNGSADENKTNDTAFVEFNILIPLPGPVVEGFEATTFPPNSWRVINADAGSLTWEKTTLASKSGSASAVIRLFDYTTTDQEDILLSSVMDVTDADSIILSFERAYKVYNASASFADTLEVVISPDCGQTYMSIWRKGGTQLASTTGTVTVAYVPAETDWANVRLDLKPFIGSAPSISVGFRTTNKFGQNIYLDDINVKAFRLPRRDAFVSTVTEPNGRVCTRTFTPVVQIGSQGRDTLKSVKVMYRIGTNPLDSVIWTGSLVNGSFASVTLKNVSMTSSGAFPVTVYTKEPNGLLDDNNANDTTRFGLTVFDAQPGPIKEGFEQNTFPPANWAIGSSNSGFTWEKTSKASSQLRSSAWIRNFRFSSNGKKDDLYSPMVQTVAHDSIYLSFDIAHVNAKFPGSTTIPMDTLEVLLTTDCGQTFRSIYKRWGHELQTVGDVNFPYTYPPTDTLGFVPTVARLWRTDKVDFTKFLLPNSKFQLVFRNSSNKGNNTFLDNINIYTVTLPARLKQNGYMIAPNPFEGTLVVQHLLPPVNLKGLQVINSAGQVIVERTFNGNAANYIQVDLRRYANGVYQVKMIYNDKVITERIIKRK